MIWVVSLSLSLFSLYHLCHHCCRCHQHHNYLSLIDLDCPVLMKRQTKNVSHRSTLWLILALCLFVFYPPQGGSVRGFFFSVASSNTVNRGQLRSITVNYGHLKSIKICQSIRASIRPSIHPSIPIMVSMNLLTKKASYRSALW